CEIGEIASAGDCILAPRHGALALRAHGRDFALDHALLECCPRAACPLDLLESAPSRAAELFGQVFYAAGAGGGIRHLREVRFFEEDELGVACNPPGESVGQAEREREWQAGDGVGAADTRRD